MQGKKRVSIRKKITRESFLAVTLVLLISFACYYYIFHIEFTERFRLRLTSFAHTAAMQINSKEHEMLKTPADEGSREYKHIKEILQAYKKANSDVKFIYTMRKTDKKDVWEFVVDAAEGSHMSHIGDLYDVSNRPEMKKAFAGPIADKNFESDQWGTFLSGYAPIYNESGQVVAIVGVDIEAITLIKQEQQIFIVTVMFFVLSTTIILLVVSRIAKRYTYPINQIMEGIRQVTAGNLNYRVKIQTDDEFEDIGNALNHTADVLIDYQKILEKDLKAAKEQQQKIFKVYRDVIYAITQSRFILMDFKEITPIVRGGELANKIKLIQPEDVHNARVLVEQFLTDRNISQRQIMHIMLCVSEAATNVIKHAKNGSMQIRILKDKIRIIVCDRGSGMDFDKLPNMLFLKGFSTKISMGSGFSIIYKFTNKIYLSTTKHGTFLAMDFND